MDYSSLYGIRGDEEEEATLAPQNPYADLYAGRQAPQEQGPQNPVARAGLGVARGVASTLEPLALPQDIAFAFTAGALDDDTSIGERLRSIEWRKYAPFGATPARPADGAEILGLMGVEDEKARRWGGLVLDFTADPLIAGSAIRAAGKLGKAESLVKLGDRVDEMVSIGGQFRAAYRVPAVKQWADRRAEELLTTARNPDNKLFGWSAGEYAKGFLTSRVTRNLRYGTESGEAMSDVRALSDQRASDVRTRAFDLLAEAEAGFLGKDARNWLGKGLGILSGARKAEQGIKGLPTILRDSMMKEAYDLAQKRGVLTTNLAESVIPEVKALSPLSSLIAKERKAQALGDTEAAISRVRELARNNNFSEELAEKRFRDFSQRVTEVDAMLGYHVSGFDLVKRRTMEMAEKNGLTREDTVKLWDDALAHGLQGRWDEFLNRPVPNYGAQRIAGQAYDDALKRGTETRTFKDMLSGADEFSALDMGAYFKGLQEGHMRRSYAMFQDSKGADGWIQSLQTGKVVMSNLLGDDMVDTALSGVRAGDKNASDLIKGYRSALEADGRGTILTQRGILNHLTENGMNKRDAQDAYMRLVGEMNPELTPVIAQLRDVASRFDAEGAGRGAGTNFYSKRNEDLDREFLEVLGEYANPILSLAESANAAKTRIGRQDFMRGVYGLASDNGLVRDGAFTDKNGAVYKLIPEEQNSMWGAYAGKYVHPYLRMELERTMKPPALSQIPLAQAAGRIRSIITGGYLASPSVITANIAGGVYTSAMAGINPGRMVTALAQTLMPLMRGESDDLKRLKEFIAVEDANMAAQGMMQNTARLKLAEGGMTKGKVGEAFDHLTGFINEQLQAPLGQKWAGLEGFAFVEKWMRTAAFKAERDYWSKNLGELNKYIPGVQNMDEASRNLAVEKFAAQKARISAMDYQELPQVVTALRDSGFLMFPGFSYLIASRNLNAAINRPGKIAMADRFNEAIWSAQMDEDEKLAVYAGMPEWLREEGGVPVRLMVDKAGDKRWSVIPFQQLLPTNTTFGKPFAESLTTLGLYTPFFEIASAFTTGEGEAIFTGRYGKQVFSPEARGVDRYTQAGEFLANSLAPGFVRKGIGMGQAISRAAVPVDPELANTMYSFQERVSGKAQRKIADEVLSSLVRAPTVITETGPLMNARKEANRLRIERDTQLRSLKKKLQEALYTGDARKAEKLQREIQERAEEYAELSQSLVAMVKGGRR